MLPWSVGSGPRYEYPKPAARDRLAHGRSRAVFTYSIASFSKLINHRADVRDLPVARRPTNEITVRVNHQGEISNEQEEPERWILDLVAASHHVDGVAILIERDVDRPSEVQGHAFRGI